MAGDNDAYRIVLVDDDLVQRKLARHACESARLVGREIQVAEFDDGSPAWDYLSGLQEHPHLLLTDLNMSMMHGNDLIRRVQAKFPRDKFPSLSIILASATSDETARELASLAKQQGYAFLRKPYEIATLKDIVRKNAPR